MTGHVPTDVARREIRARRSSGAAATAADAIRPVVARALSALERSDIQWALLRGESELGSPEGDVDVLVAASDLPRLADELGRLGFGRLRRYGRGPHTFFLAYDAPEGCWVKLDVVTRLAYGPYQELALGGAAGCLERRRSTGRLVVLTADDGFWTLLLHCLLDGGGFPDTHRRALLSLADGASASGPLAQTICGVLPKEWGADTLLGLAKAEDWVALEGSAPFLRAHWLSRSRLTGRARALGNRTMRRLGRVPPLCGPGLTVLTRPANAALAAAVAECWPFPHRRLRVEGSLALRLRNLALTRWHAARGRLVLVALAEDMPPSRLLERVVGGSDFGALGLSEDASVQEATAGIWRRYVERSRG
jgi:hypothetical protein